MQYLAHVHRSLSVGSLPVHQIRWDWGFIIICVIICKSLFSEDKCVLILPILDPYSSHMTLPMWVQHGTLLQIPHESLMGCPYRTHINTHLGPMWVLYFLLAGQYLITVPKSAYRDTFKKWLHRLKLCISSHGEYFEGMK